MICVYGLGLVGKTTVQGLQSWHHHVMGFDENDALPELSETDILWLTLEPDPELRDWKKSVWDAFVHLSNGTLVILSSQVPVGTTRWLQLSWSNLRIVYAPENLTRNQPLIRFLEPERIVLGSIDGIIPRTAINLYPPRLHHRIITMNFESAEISKHALNSYLALNICFANDIAKFCREHGADYDAVCQTLQCDSRVGPNAYIQEGKADGSHLLRDVQYLLNAGMHKPRNRSLMDQIMEHDSWTK